MPDFTVAEVDESGKWADENGVIKPMWIIAPIENVKLKTFRYGQLPGGWKEIHPSVPLELDTWYTAGAHYFRFYKDVGRVRSEILSHSAYWDQKHREQRAL